ncbi:hypothetical protein M0805_000484 [Coniferiporia weirii]|nr:hypothetical protein M0805_000484 [Coniferiporia weirii]
MSVTVKWGREKLYIPIPAPDAKLGVLRATLAEHTALPPASFKLVHAGAVMKDDGAPISAYGVRPGSTIALIGGAGGAPESISAAKEKEKQKPTTEEGTVAVIRDELARVQERLAPALEAFLVTITPPSPVSPDVPPASTDSSPDVTTSASVLPPTSAPAPTAIPTPLPNVTLDVDMEHRRIGEELLQALLRLDMLALDGAWTTARAERKGAVKTVQDLLDRLDGGWRESKKRTEQSVQ